MTTNLIVNNAILNRVALERKNGIIYELQNVVVRKIHTVQRTVDCVANRRHAYGQSAVVKGTTH